MAWCDFFDCLLKVKVVLSQHHSVNRVCCDYCHLTNSSTALDCQSRLKRHSLSKELSHGWIGIQRADEVSIWASWPPPLAVEEELTVTMMDPSSFPCSVISLQGVVATSSRILTGLCQAYLGKSTMSPWWTGGRTLKRYFAVPAECFGILYGLGGRQGQSNCRPFWRFKRKCELGSHVLLKQLRLWASPHIKSQPSDTWHPVERYSCI
jgi:hypothetical protein